MPKGLDIKLTFSKALLRAAVDSKLISEKSAIAAAQGGDPSSLTKFVARATYNKFFETYRRRTGLRVYLLRKIGLDPDRKDALKASWGMLNNSSIVFEASHG